MSSHSEMSLDPIQDPLSLVYSHCKRMSSSFCLLSADHRPVIRLQISWARSIIRLQNFAVFTALLEKEAYSLKGEIVLINASGMGEPILVSAVLLRSRDLLKVGNERPLVQML